MSSNPLHSRFESLSSRHADSIEAHEPIPPMKPLTHLPNMDNGDCVYYCLYQLLNQLAPMQSTRMSRATIAGHMRSYINEYYT
eukprot:4151255-Prymnesium_polylepis.1